MATTETVKYVFDAITGKFEENIDKSKKKVNELDSATEKSSKNIDKSLNTASTSAKNLGNSFENAGKRLTIFSGVATVALGGIIKLGLDNEAGIKRFNKVFGSETDNIIKKFEELNGAVRITDNEFKNYSASVGDILKPLGFSESATADLTIEIIKNAQALSDWTGVPFADAVDSQTKALLGSREGLEKFGIKITQEEVNLLAYAKAGVQTAKDFDKLELSLRQQYETLATNELIINKSADAIEEFGKGNLTTAQKLDTAWTNTKQVFEEVFTNAIAPILINVSNKILALSKSFQNLDVTTQRVIGALLIFSSVLAPILIILGKTFKSIGFLIGGFTKYYKILNELNPTLTAFGVKLLLIVGIIAVVLIALYLFRDKLKPIFDTINVYIQSVVNKFLEFKASIQPIIDAVIENIMKFANVFVSFYNEYVAPNLEKIINLFKQIAEVVLYTYETAIAPFVQLVIQAISLLVEFLTPIINWIINLLSIIIPFAIDLFVAKLKNSFDTIGFIINAIVTVVTTVVSGVIKMFKGLIDFIVGIFTLDFARAFSGLKDFIAAPFETAFAIVEGLFNDLVKFFTKQVDNVKGIFSSIGDFAGNVGSFINPFDFNHLISGNIDGFNKAPSIVNNNTWVINGSNATSSVSRLSELKNRATLVNGGSF